MKKKNIGYIIAILLGVGALVWVISGEFSHKDKDKDEETVTTSITQEQESSENAE